MSNIKVLITGNLGYVGSELVKYLRKKNDGIEIIGYDTGYFAHNLSRSDALPEINISNQYFRDIRKIDHTILHGVDIVVHLAAISNDPMGNLFKDVTHEINALGTLKIAELACKAGVKNFVFASSCSMYGASSTRTKEESDELDPLTAYAKSKVEAEKLISNIDSDMVITALRFATACGMTERLRLDLVLNDFVASAILNGEIRIMSDGTPWRPLIHVSDMCRAIDWAMHRNSDVGGKFLAINTGSDEWNYQVNDLALAVSEQFNNVKILTNPAASKDNRSYKVNFNLFKSLAPLQYQPQESLASSIIDLKNGIEGMLSYGMSINLHNYMRLKVLERHMQLNNLSSDLRWI